MSFSLVVKFGRSDVAVEVEEDATIGDLHRVLEERTGVIARKQKLLYKGRVLSVGEPLKEAGIKNRAKLMLLASEGIRTNGQETIAQMTARQKLTKPRERVHQRPDMQASVPSILRRTAEDQVRMWSTLKIVTCGDLGLSTFPTHALEVGASAEIADFSHNELLSLPSEIQQLIQLKSLDFTKNRLTSEGVFKLTNLQKLHLDHNQIEDLSPSMGCLIALERLTLSHNDLKALPDAFHQLQNLTELDISHNAIVELPASLGKCSELKTLNARNNRIREIPECFSALFRLRILRADNNRIVEIRPSLLKECTSLVMFSLHGNPLTMQQFREADGFDDYEKRRQGQYDKKLGTGAMQLGEHFDEGADYERK